MRDYFLKTERLGFSCWEVDDIGLAQLLWGDPEVTKYISASGRFSTRDIEERLAKEINNQSHFHVQYWPIFDLENNQFIGCCGLRPYNLTDDIYEIGFHLCSNSWGKGFATEAAKAIIDYAETTLKVKGLFAGHHPANASSAKMLEKLGFYYTHDEYYPPTGLNHLSYRYRF